MEEFSKPSVESVLQKIFNYATRPVTEFNKYDVLEMLETLQNTARDTAHEQRDFYRLVHHTIRAKIEFSNDYIRTLVLQLLGGKDHQKVLDAVIKVDKSMAKSQLTQTRTLSHPYPSPYTGRLRKNVSQLRCYACNRVGHIAAKCLVRKAATTTATSSNNMSEKK